MFNRPLLVAFVLVLILAALAAPQLASIFFFNLANTQIARAVALPTDAPARATLLADADANLARAKTFSNPPRLSLAQARLALARNDAPLALAAFDSADLSAQNDFIAQFVWGDAAWRAGQRDAAFSHWRSAGAREFFRQEMYRAEYAHRWQDAAEDARIVIGIAPDAADGHYMLGNALAQQNVNDPGALLELDRAWALTQDKEFLSTILSRRGEILASQNKLQDALAAFDEARQIAPRDARPRTGYALAALKIDSNVKSQSVTLLTEVIGDSPWYVGAYIALAEISDDEAETWLKKGLDKNPNDASLLFALGQWYARRQRTFEARTTLVAAMQNETRADLLQKIVRALAELPAP